MRVHHRLASTLIAGAALLLAVAPATAQTVRHSLTGRVLDQTTGTPIRAAVVQIAKMERRVLTDSLGRFSFSNLPAGPYMLAASALGYRPTIVSAATDAPVVMRVAPEPVPLAGIVALTRTRSRRLRGATQKVFGREELIAAGDIPVAQFVQWKAHFITRPCQMADPDAVIPLDWLAVECIIGPRGSFAPVRVIVDGQPLMYSSEMWSHKTWDLGRVEVTYQYTAVDMPFGRPFAVVRMYSLPYLARTAARLGHICDRVSTADTIADRHLASLCGL